MTEGDLKEGTPVPAVDAEVRGKSSKLFKAAALFASGVAATAAMMGPGAHKIADVIGDMQARGHEAKQVAPAAKTSSPTPSAQTITAHAAPTSSIIVRYFGLVSRQTLKHIWRRDNMNK